MRNEDSDDGQNDRRSSGTMTRYWLIKAAEEGAPTILERREEPMPSLEGRQMLVQIKSISLMRGDLMARIKRLGAEQPRPAGIDASGIVLEAGDSGYRSGDRVMFMKCGCFANYAAVDPELASHIPERMSFDHAAAVPGAFSTAWTGLFECGRVSKDDWILLCGASSGVGVAALQVAKLLGAKVIATSTSKAKLGALAALGADAVVEASGSAFADEVLRLTGGKGVNLSLNMVGGSALPGCVRVSADFGRVVMIGYVDGQMSAECDIEAVHGRRLVICGASNGPLSMDQRAEAYRGFMRDVYPALASGSIVPVIDKVFPFDQTPQAKAYFDSYKAIGKVVVSVP